MHRLLYIEQKIIGQKQQKFIKKTEHISLHKIICKTNGEH